MADFSVSSVCENNSDDLVVEQDSPLRCSGKRQHRMSKSLQALNTNEIERPVEEDESVWPKLGER